MYMHRLSLLEFFELDLDSQIPLSDLQSNDSAKQPTQQPAAEPLHQSKNSRPGIAYSQARTDRSGAAIQDMLMAHAYAFSRNLTYGGACSLERLQHKPAHDKLIQALGLQEIIPFACPNPNDTAKPVFLERKHYKNESASSVITPEWIQHIQQQVLYPASDATSRTSVVVHIRRGDVDPCTTTPCTTTKKGRRSGNIATFRTLTIYTYYYAMPRPAQASQSIQKGIRLTNGMTLATFLFN
jgi:hypothetical protein